MTDDGWHFSRRGALLLAAAASSSCCLPVNLRAAASTTGIPKPSDVVFSPRWEAAESIEIARSAGSTRCDWTYIDRGPFFDEMKVAGISGSGGAINMIPPDRPGVASYQIGREFDRAGRTVEAPWLRGKGLFWGCVNNPDFLKLQVARAKAQLRLGAEWLQHDDPAGAIQAVSFAGGCWCSFCRARAAAEGADLETGMLSFQQRSTVDYINALRGHLNEFAGRKVVMSNNNFGLRRGIPFTLFDYGMCEIDPNDAGLANLSKLYRQFEQDSWMQVVTLRSRDLALNRSTIAAVHALGGAMIYPYNVYMPVGDRFTAQAADVVPLYQYVRTIGAMLNASTFVDQAAESVLTSESMVALDRAGVSPILRRAGTQTVVHFIPGRYDRSAQNVPVAVRAMPSLKQVRSADRPASRSFSDEAFFIAPWDWSTLTVVT